MGARFAKWRAVIAVGDAIPSPLAASGRTTHRRWLVMPCCARKRDWSPSSQRKCSWNGHQTMERCREVTEEVLRTVFTQLYAQRVTLEGTILKPNTASSRIDLPHARNGGRLGRRHGEGVSCEPSRPPFRGLRSRRAATQPQLASARLNAMNVRFKSDCLGRWHFRFPARAIEQPALEIWRGQEANASAAQQLVNRRAKCNRAARRGEYSVAMEENPLALSR